MGIEAQFSSSVGRRDQGPNRVLARQIVAGRDDDGVAAVIGVLTKKNSTRVRNDAILTVAAISDDAPELLTPYIPELTALLQSNVNRQVFGAMIALANISPLVPERLTDHLALILDAMDKGTVVTRDHGYTILTQLYKIDKAHVMLPLILEQLMKAPPNQLGQYAEKFISVMDYADREALTSVLEQRLGELDNPNHRTRLIKSLSKLARG